MLETNRALLTPLLGDQPAYSPQTLFLNGEQGGIYDPADLTPDKLAWVAANPGFTSAQFLAAFPLHTLYQDARGATPVTALGQPVGLVLDTTQGALANLGPELVDMGALPAPTFDDAFSNSPAWNGSIRTLSFSATSTSNQYPRAYFNFGLASGTRYFIRGRFSGNLTAIASLRMSLSGTANPVTYNSTTGVFQSIQVAAAAGVQFFMNGTLAAPQSVVLEELSIRTIPGNHLTQTTTASRPVLDARVNLVTYSDEFDNPIWAKNGSAVTANTTVAPDGTTTADPLTASAGAGFHYLNAVVSLLATSYTYTIHVKKGTSRWIFFGITDTALNYFDFDTGSFGTTPATCASTDLGNGWWRLTATATQTAGSASGVNVGVASGNGGGSFTATGTETVIIWRSDLRFTTDIAYPPQRVGAATDYADVGAPRSFAFDGVDDSLFTSSNMNLSGTDKVTVLSGMRKLSDAAQGVVAELTATVASNNGAFLLAAPDGATATFGWDSKGTAQVDAVASSLTAPITRVVTGLADIVGDSCIIRVNGAQADSDTGDQGTGNYSSAVFFVGRRNNATLPFNGKLYQLIVRGAATDAGTLVQAERYVSQRTGITL